MATPQLFRKLKTAANASKPFINACKRALEGVLAQPDVSVSFQSQSQGDGLSQEQDGAVEEADLDLKEDELRAWREATEPLQKVLPENTIYFIPYTLLNSSAALDAASATTLLVQINAINLGLTLEMFLPQSTRRKFPMLTTQIPFIDASSQLDGAAKVASSQTDEQSYPSSGFNGLQYQLHSGYSQSMTDLTQEQKIDLLTLPLAELKSVYLRLCAGRKEKHVLYVLRRVILEICCISIITSTKARGLKTFKPKDLLDTFKVTFLKDPGLVDSDDVDGGGGVFATKEVQEKACKLWEKWAGDVMHRFQAPLTAQHAYTWEALADTLLTDLMRHVLPLVLEKLEVEGKRKVSLPTSTVSAVNATTVNNNTHNGPRAPTNDTQAGGGKSTKLPEKSRGPPAAAAAASPDQPRDSRFFVASKKTAMKSAATAAAVTTSKSTATAAVAAIPKPAAVSISSTNSHRTAFSTTADRTAFSTAADRTPFSTAADRTPFSTTAHRAPFSTTAHRTPFSTTAHRTPFSTTAHRTPFSTTASKPTTALKPTPTPTPTTSFSTTAPKPTTPAALNVDIDEDEFGPRLVNPAHKGRIVLPDTERTVIHAPGTAVHEFDMMDYVQDYGGDDVGGGFGNDNAGLGNDDAGGAVNEEQEDGGTPFAVAVARFGQEPYIPPPKFGFTRVPENFRFNAPQRNAVKVVMTPSPESEKGSSYVPPKGSTLNKIKAAVVHSDRGGQGRGTSVEPDSEEDAEDAPADDAVVVVKKGRKRKQSDEEDEYAEEPRVKKRKGGNGKAMPPPARVPLKPTGTVASTTTTIVNPPPYAARHSSASSSTLFNPSDMAGPSSSRGTVAVRPIVKHPVVMADTDSSDDEGPFRRRKPPTSSKTATITKAAPAPAPAPTKSTSVASRATASKKTSTSITQKATAAKKTSTSVAASVQPKPRKAVPLPVSDELMKSSKERLSQIKEINEKNKRLYAALVGEDEEDPDATEEDSGDDNEEELRKFRERREREARGELRGPAIGDLEKSRNKLEDLKKRSKEVEKLPVRRRAKNAAKVKGEAGSSGDEDELDEEEEEEEEERVDVPRPRGRPPKNPKAKAKGSTDKRERGARTYKYAVGGNEHGRSRWTEEEDKILLFALEATFYEGDLLRPWQKIRGQYGPDGTEGDGLAARNVMQMKDRARAIAEKMIREGRERPDYLAWIKVSQKRVTKK